MIKLILILCLFIIFFIKNKEYFQINPCTDYLSEDNYLIHMIPHHQVAIDMCNLMIPISKSKTIQKSYISHNRCL